MNAGLLTAVLSAGAAIIVAVLTYVLTKRKEREADWRKMMLEKYKEFTAALSGFLEGRSITDAARERFVDASNAMNLVASATTISALYIFFQECLYAHPPADHKRQNELTSNVLLARRRDINPSLNSEITKLSLMSITPKPFDLFTS